MSSAVSIYRSGLTPLLEVRLALDISLTVGAGLQTRPRALPELPEVEAVRRQLRRVMEGARIERVETRRADLRSPFPADFAARLEGQRVTALRRRAKYLLADLESGETLLMHLGMSGSFRVVKGRRDEVQGGSTSSAAGSTRTITCSSRCRRAQRSSSTIHGDSA